LVIGTDYIGRCKSNHNKIATMMPSIKYITFVLLLLDGTKYH